MSLHKKEKRAFRKVKMQAQSKVDKLKQVHRSVPKFAVGDNIFYIDNKYSTISEISDAVIVSVGNPDPDTHTEGHEYVIKILSAENREANVLEQRIIKKDEHTIKLHDIMKKQIEKLRDEITQLKIPKIGAPSAHGGARDSNSALGSAFNTGGPR